MSEELSLVNLLEDAFWDELDRQQLDTDEVYVQPGSSLVDGVVDVPALIRHLLEVLREEEGQ